jgi:hypothetical protein
MADPTCLSTKITPNPAKGNAEYVVDQLFGSVGAKHAFTWEAPDDSAITIMFPPTRDPLGIGCKTIEPGEPLIRHLSRADVPDRLPKNTYRYAIFCHRTNNFAVMNSDPEIIIVE